MTRRTRALVVIVALVIPMVGSAAETHYGFNRNAPAGFRLGRAHEGLDLAMVGLVAERNAMVQMRDGADCPSDAACYAAVTAAYGFSSNAEARGAFLELDSLVAKLTSDASQTNVKAAIDQFLSRLRS
ncbi:MAG TPA: hypothetical protein VEA16_08385 [Vicinamibacterales bacterium]|nr:hypothetical protein [Vicinamibacterales bacterium]